MKLLRKIRNKNGFTLAELLVVIGIITVLAAVAIPGVATYSKKIRLRELDDSARAIYMAAQHKFTAEVEMGEQLDKEDIGNKCILNPIPSRYKVKEDANITVKYKIVHDIDESLTNVGFIEPELSENNYVIEYNAETGDVYGVFYSNDEDEDFSDYINKYNTDGEKYVLAAGGDYSKRTANIGFYGIDNETEIEVAPEPGDIPEPVVELINKEKLVLTVKTSEPAYVAIKMYQTDSPDKSVVLIDKSRNVTLTNSGFTLILDSLTPKNGASALSTASELSLNEYEDSFENWSQSVIDPGADITVEVTFYDEAGIAIDKTEKRTENSLFAKVSTSEGKYTAHIKYGRHLQNLDKCASVTTAEIDRTINFASDKDNYEGWAKYYGDFVTLCNISTIDISAINSYEIQNISISANENDPLYSGLFSMLHGANATNLIFRHPTVKGDISGSICAYSENSHFVNIKVINPDITSESTSGGLIGMDNNSSVSDCCVYVEEDVEKKWGDPNDDPFSKYVINSEATSGGLIGWFMGTKIDKSFASVKVFGKQIAGGLCGAVESYGEEAVISNSFVAGHTYHGLFNGKSEDNVDVKLTDNVKGNFAGGIIGKIGGEIQFDGVVYSTCSVTGTRVDLLGYIDNPERNKLVIKTDSVYTLGVAYDESGNEIKVDLPEGAQSAEDVKDETLNNTEIPYDLYLRSQNFNYPTAGLTMHGDWPSNDKKPVTGFFYWEKEDGNYHIYALGYDGAKLSEIAVADDNKLCKNQDAKNIESFGYGAFSAGGELASTDVTLANTSSADLTGSFDIENPTTNEIAKILAAVEDLNEDVPDKYSIILYTLKSDQHPGLVTATVGEQEYTFAPEFYALYAEKDGVSCGTAAGLFGVRAKEQLINAANHLDGKFKQSHDIDFADSSLTPIGNSENVFKGAYNGGSYRILNAKITSSATTEHAGLFGVTEGATLENIVMFKVAATADKFTEITGQNVGVIVGEAKVDEAGHGVIRNCVAAGYTLTGSVTSGGVAGKSSTEITNCEANIRFGKVTGAAGGIVGEGATVKSSYALVHGIDSPSSKMELGGIAGKATGVEDCYVIFSGQTVGYPVANVTDNSKNYFMQDDGYYPKKGDNGNAGKGRPVETEDEINNPSLKNAKPATSTQISYTSVSSPRDEVNKYEYTALVKDLVMNVNVHYGPVPKAMPGALTTGPIAGIYHFREYSYYSKDGVPQHSGNFDGLISYNKHNQLFYDEKLGVSSNGFYPFEYIGILLEQSCSIEDPDLEIKINGKSISKDRIKKFTEQYSASPESFIQGSGDYHFLKQKDEEDAYTHYGEVYNTNIQKRFEYYVILQDGKPMQFTEDDCIEIWYTNRYTKENGILIRAYGTSYSKINHLSFMAELPQTNFDEDNVPRIGGFFAKKSQSNSYPNDYFVQAIIEATAMGHTGNESKGSVVGIFVEEDRVDDLKQGRLTVALDKMFVELEPLETAKPDMIIANEYELNTQGYKAYVVVGLPDSAVNNAHEIDFFYGSNKFATVQDGLKMTGGNGDRGNEEYDIGSSEYQKVVDQYKNKIAVIFTASKNETDSAGNITETKYYGWGKYADGSDIGQRNDANNNITIRLLIDKSIDISNIKVYNNSNNVSTDSCLCSIKPSTFDISTLDNSSDFEGYNLYDIDVVSIYYNELYIMYQKYLIADKLTCKVG